MKSPLSQLACLLFGLLLMTGVHADDKSGKTASRFSEHDLDGDGYISLQEYKLFREKRSDRQKFGNNQGTPRYRWRTMRFVEIDTNRDGLISKDEMLEALQKRFDRPCPGQQQPNSRSDKP
ncbi:MAG: EF-hand domain-containing protein [Gammaproteobacteria bacterium]|nr:EF-hand domain-containing protein [Gammaproteobacteria bacterium]